MADCCAFCRSCASMGMSGSRVAVGGRGGLSSLFWAFFFVYQVLVESQKT